MSQPYASPRSALLGFVTFFIGVIIALAITQDPRFRKYLSFQYLTSICLALVVFLYPSVIYLQLWLSEDGSTSSSDSWSVLKVEAMINLVLCALMVALGTAKYLPRETRTAGPTDLHWQINNTYWEDAREIWQLPPRRTKDPTYLENKTQAWKWYASVTYLGFRYVLLYVLFIPFNIGCNIYIASSLYTSSLITPTATFNDVVFAVVFSLALITSTAYLELKVGTWQAWCNAVVLVHVATISYFAAESPVLIALLFATLAIYLSTTFDMIVDTLVFKSYNYPHALMLQILAWIRRDEPARTQSSHGLLQQLRELDMPRRIETLEGLVDGLRSEKLGGAGVGLESEVEMIRDVLVTWYDETHPDHRTAMGAYLTQPLEFPGSRGRVYNSARLGDDGSLIIDSSLGSDHVQEKVSLFRHN